MQSAQKIILSIILFVSANNYAQLGFCTGSKGEPIFDENFGNGTTYGPALPSGTTNYSFISGSPNDGSYTLYYRTNLYSTWHYSFDHTPDATNGANGKSLIVNGNANTSGEFYKRTVTGLCINTTFEFSAWVMNVYNPGSAFCGINEKPINVQFEIWNDTETILLGSGNTGNIMGSAAPLWQQFGLVFTTTNQTSVVLKMKNNGVGGCGNDLAIDDVIFRSCGDLTTISSTLTSGNNYTVCQNQSPISTTLQATTTGSSTYFYQWQSSNDGLIWTDIIGATSSNYVVTNINTSTHFRTKVAQDIVNLSNSFCSTSSNVFSISLLPSPNNCISNGDFTICSNEPLPILTVSTPPTVGVNWYDAAIGGNLLQSNSNVYSPAGSGTFFAEAFDLNTNCTSTNRTAVSLNIVSLPIASITGTAAICSGNSTVITINGTPNAIVNYTVDGSANQTIILGNNGIAEITTPNLFANSTYTLVSVASNVINTCVRTLNASALITVTPEPFVVLTGESQVCYGNATTLNFNGTANATVTYTVNNGMNQLVTLNGNDEALVTLNNMTQNTICSLVSVTANGTNGCTQFVSQSIAITVIPLPIANLSVNPATICPGQTSILSFSGTPNAIITYSENGGINQTIALNDSGGATVVTANLFTNTTYELKSVAFQGSSNCSQLLSTLAVVNVIPNAIVTYTGATEYCSKQTTDISLFSDLAGTTFNWTVTQNGVSGSSAGFGNQIIQTLTTTATNGMVSYFVTPTYNGCIGNTIQIDVKVNALPIPTLTNGTICVGTENENPLSEFYTLITNLNTVDYTFIWYFDNALIPNANQNTFDAYATGTYTVIATNTNTGCVSEAVSAEVSASEKGESLVIEQSEAFSNNSKIIVTVIGGIGPFLYQLDNGNFQYSNVLEPVSSGIHNIYVTDENNCTNLSSTLYIVNYPKYFTPNNDGYNDSWNIQDLQSKTSIFIYDKFGKLLKQIQSNGQGWDGTSNGKSLPSSDYWFTIDYVENGTEKTFKSHFTLKR